MCYEAAFVIKLLEAGLALLMKRVGTFSGVMYCWDYGHANGVLVIQHHHQADFSTDGSPVSVPLSR